MLLTINVVLDSKILHLFTSPVTFSYFRFIVTAEHTGVTKGIVPTLWQVSFVEREIMNLINSFSTILDFYLLS